MLINTNVYWLVSYPKSGNTWIRTLLTNYWLDAREPTSINQLMMGASHIHRDEFDAWLGLESSDLTVEEIDEYRPAYHHSCVMNIEEPCVIKVHDAYTHNNVGQPLFPASITKGVVYLVRNPLDIAVSYAHHANQSIGKTIENMSDVHHMLLPQNDQLYPNLRQRLLSWNMHVTSWSDSPHVNILLLRYEDLSTHTLEVLQKLVQFLDWDIDEKRLERAVTFSAFDLLKSQETENGFNGRQATACSFFRKGKIDAWKGALNDQQIEQITSDHFQVMHSLGYVSKGGGDA